MTDTRIVTLETLADALASDPVWALYRGRQWTHPGGRDAIAAAILAALPPAPARCDIPWHVHTAEEKCSGQEPAPPLDAERMTDTGDQPLWVQALIAEAVAAERERITLEVKRLQPWTFEHSTVREQFVARAAVLAIVNPEGPITDANGDELEHGAPDAR